MNLSKIWAVILPFLSQTKNYARVVGVILFLIGLLGFAFRSDNSLPDGYLVGALVLGFWGILSGIAGGAKQETVKKVTETEQYSSES